MCVLTDRTKLLATACVSLQVCRSNYDGQLTSTCDEGRVVQFKYARLVAGVELRVHGGDENHMFVLINSGYSPAFCCHTPTNAL